jgi:selenoprotein W-related protein
LKQVEASMEKPRIVIQYCSQCRFVLRATWLAQELLFTFGEALGEVALQPGSGGVFEVRIGDELIFDRKALGRFPESSELKQLVRDRVDPERNLGHSERRVVDGGLAEP